MFTDRSASKSARPSELDWILGLAFRWRDTEYREQDRPLDRPGLVQLRVSFDVPSASLGEESNSHFHLSPGVLEYLRVLMRRHAGCSVCPPMHIATKVLHH